MNLAREVGASMGPFAVVATSVVPRARETAMAMGFAVDHELVSLTGDEEMYAKAEASKWWLAEQPFVALASSIRTGGAYYRYAHSMAALWRDLLTPLSDGRAALVVGHSGELEATLVACLPNADHGSWGETFASCEGGRLVFSGEPARFRDVELIRLPASRG